MASGPTAKTVGVEKLKGRMRCIVVNNAFQLCPWADILYACEGEWWVVYAKEVKKFTGIKLMLADPARNIPDTGKITIPKVKNMWVDDFLFEQPGVIGSGGNGGFQAINLAAQFGTKRIALVGFDMRIAGSSHWHGNHPSPLRNPDDGRCEAWRRVLDEKAPKLLARGIDVVNCSSLSALTTFPKMTIDQMLERWKL